MNGIYFKAHALMLSAALLMSGTMVGMDGDGHEVYLQTGEIVPCYNPIADAHAIIQEHGVAVQNSQDPYSQKLVEACDAFKRNENEQNAKAVNHAHEISQTAYYLARTNGDKKTLAKLLAYQENAALKSGCGHVVVVTTK